MFNAFIRMQTLRRRVPVRRCLHAGVLLHLGEAAPGPPGAQLLAAGVGSELPGLRRRGLRALQRLQVEALALAEDAGCPRDLGFLAVEPPARHVCVRAPARVIYGWAPEPRRARAAAGPKTRRRRARPAAPPSSSTGSGGAAPGAPSPRRARAARELAPEPAASQLLPGGSWAAVAVSV